MAPSAARCLLGRLKSPPGLRSFAADRQRRRRGPLLGRSHRLSGARLKAMRRPSNFAARRRRSSRSPGRWRIGLRASRKPTRAGRGQLLQRRDPDRPGPLHRHLLRIGPTLGSGAGRGPPRLSVPSRRLHLGFCGTLGRRIQAQADPHRHSRPGGVVGSGRDRADSRIHGPERDPGGYRSWRYGSRPLPVLSRSGWWAGMSCRGDWRAMRSSPTGAT
jgi:hypothetical protein